MNRNPLIAAGTLLGVGMGGFVDGILLHQIFQLHSMLSAKMPQDVLVNVKISMVWDGLFHALTWITTAVGLSILWNAGKRKDCPWSGKTIWGAMFLGWGLFNFIEGIIDHHLLQIHHVVKRLGVSVYDYLFLGSGIVFILLGWGLIKAGRSAKVASQYQSSQ